MHLESACSCLCATYWSQVLSGEWRCSWSSADRRCSNYIWMIKYLIAYKGVSYIRDLTVLILHPTVIRDLTVLILHPTVVSRLGACIQSLKRWIAFRAIPFEFFDYHDVNCESEGLFQKPWLKKFLLWKNNTADSTVMNCQHSISVFNYILLYDDSFSSKCLFFSSKLWDKLWHFQQWYRKTSNISCT